MMLSPSDLIRHNTLTAIAGAITKPILLTNAAMSGTRDLPISGSSQKKITIKYVMTVILPFFERG